MTGQARWTLPAATATLSRAKATHLPPEEAPDSHTEPPCSALAPRGLPLLAAGKAGQAPCSTWASGRRCKGKKSFRRPGPALIGPAALSLLELPLQSCCLSCPWPCHPGDRRLQTGCLWNGCPREAARGRPRADFTQVPASCGARTPRGRSAASLAAPADRAGHPGQEPAGGGEADCPDGQQERVHPRLPASVGLCRGAGAHEAVAGF